MRRSAVGSLLLPLMLLQSALQGSRANTTLKPIILSEEMKQLRYIMYQQGTMLVDMKMDLEDVKKENEGLKNETEKLIKQAASQMDTLNKEMSAQKAEMASLRSALAASESEVKKLKNDKDAQQAEISAIGTKLAATERDVEQLKKDNEALKKIISAVEDDVKSLRKEIAANTASLDAVNTAVAANKQELEKLAKEKSAQIDRATLNNMQTVLTVADSEVRKLKIMYAVQANELSAVKLVLENLKKAEEHSGGTKVAFSAGLGLPSGLRGPLSSETRLIYRNVITNVGNAYSSSTGVFTAPARGVYYFRFTGSVYYHKEYIIGVNLYKNGQWLIHLGENSFNGLAKDVSTGITLELVAGDQVYTNLPAKYVLWDDLHYRTSFSGFFLFPM